MKNKSENRGTPIKGEPIKPDKRHELVKQARAKPVIPLSTLPYHTKYKKAR